MGAFSGTLGSLWVEIGAKISNFEKAMADVSKQIDATVSDAEKRFAGFDKLGSTLTGVGTKLSIGLTAPILAIGAASVKASGDFDSAMRLVSARGDITGGDLAKLKKQAEDLGAATQFSSKQAAEGMAEFAGAGFKTDQIFAALPGTMNLAAAAQTSVGQAATVAKDLLGQFGFQASDTGHVVDVLAKASNEGSGTLMQMADSLKYVGPVAHAAGLSLEQTGSALLVLDKAGIRGEQAGTSLRAMLASLSGPSKEAAGYINELGIKVTDSSGKMLPFSNIIEQFRQALAKIPNEADKANNLVQIFGRESLAAATILTSQGAPALIDFEGRLKNVAGEAQRTAEVMNSGMGGSLERMRGSIETAAQKIGDILAPTVIALAGHVESAANGLAKFAGWFQQLPGPVQGTALAVVGLTAAIGPALLVAGQLANAIVSINTVLPLMSGGLSLVTKTLGLSTVALAGWTAGISVAVVAVGSLVYAYQQMTSAQAGAEKAQKTYADSISILESKLRSHGADISSLRGEYDKGLKSQDEYAKALRKLASELGDANKPTKAAVDSTTDLQKIQKQIAEQVGKVAKATKDAASETKSYAEFSSKAAKQDDVLFEIAGQLEAAHKKQAAEIAKARIELGNIAGTIPKVIAPSDELNESIQRIIASAKHVAPEFVTALSTVDQQLTAALEPIHKVDDAYKALGINSTESLDRVASKAKEAYETIRDSGTASARDIDAAWAKSEKARIDAARANGEQVSAAYAKSLDTMLDKLNVTHATSKKSWDTFGRDVSTTISNFSQDMVKSLFEGGGSFADKGLSALKSLGEAVVTKFTEPFTAAATDLMTGAISDLLGGKGFGGILDSIKNIGKAVTDVFGGTASTAGGVASGAGGLGSAGGAGGAGGAVANGGMMAVGGLILGGISAISGIIGNFQNARQENTLNAIEESTRYSKIYLGGQGQSIIWCAQTIAAAMVWVNGSLDDIRQKLQDWLEPTKTSLDEVVGWLDPAQGSLRSIAEAASWAMKRLDQIGNDVMYGSAADRDNSAILRGIADRLGSQQAPIINVYINGQQVPNSAVSLKLQGAVGL